MSATTTSTPTTFDPDAQIVERCWSAARPFLASPCSDDAPVADRMRAITAAVHHARETRRRVGDLPARQAALIDTFDEESRRARPSVKVDSPKRPSPLFLARALRAMASTPARTAQMLPSEIAAADAVCAGSPHADFQRALADAEAAFLSALEAEVVGIPQDERQLVGRHVDPGRIERETATLRDEPVVPANDRNDVRLPVGSPA